MKKLLITLAVVCAVLVAAFPAEAKAPPYQITFESFTMPHAVSGATSISAGSGTTKLVGVHSGQKRTTGNQYVDMANPAEFGGMGPVVMVWLEDLDFCPAQINNAGTVSDTFDAWLELFPKNGLTSSVTRYLFKDEPITSLQNNTAGPYVIDIPPNMYAVPYAKSGTTGLGNIRIGMLAGLSSGVKTQSVRSAASAYAMTASSGMETITVPNGVRRVILLYAGDGVLDVEWSGGSASVDGSANFGSGYGPQTIVLDGDLVSTITAIADSGVTLTRIFEY
jgi:hypothetical protein